jgi:alpha-tubulin suppressor-like RCC1 family protein
MNVALISVIGLITFPDVTSAARLPAPQSSETVPTLRFPSTRTQGETIPWFGVANGISNTCATLVTGTVQCWGDSFYGQVGDGYGDFTTGISEARSVPTPTDVVGLANQIEVAVGLTHVCARSSIGVLSCWGSNSGHKINASNMLATSLPTPIIGVADVIGVALGSTHTCVLVQGGVVKCWGSNLSGQLGDGTTDDRAQPTAVVSLPLATQISSFGAHTCARTVDGKAWCWGANDFGALGNTNLIVYPTPFEIPGLAQVAEVRTGAYHSCARLENGTVSCWGSSNNGELGDGTIGAPWRDARPVPGLSGVTAITVGTPQTCVVVVGGAVKCWGGEGALGNGFPIFHNYEKYPGTVIIGDSAKAVSASVGITCALTMTGQLKCWGRDERGQLGDGEGTYNQYYPTPVLATAFKPAPPRRTAASTN